MKEKTIKKIMKRIVTGKPKRRKKHFTKRKYVAKPKHQNTGIGQPVIKATGGLSARAYKKQQKKEAKERKQQRKERHRSLTQEGIPRTVGCQKLGLKKRELMFRLVNGIFCVDIQN